MQEAVHFELPEAYDRERIVRFLDGRFTYRVDAPTVHQRRYYDTFDWRLFGESLVLCRQDDELVLMDLAQHEATLRSGWAHAPVFAHDLPGGSLRDRVGPLIAERALLSLASAELHTTVYRILNRDEKTIARLVYASLYPWGVGTGESPTAYLSLIPVRGYAKRTQDLAQEMGHGRPVLSVEEAILRAALAAENRAPGDYSAKLDLQLDCAMRSDDAAKAILRELLTTLHANEAGIRADTDAEFLHDYRVAVRKTRSALSQIKDVFPTDVTERYKQAFRELGQSTNALRDLDVYLQAEPDYRALLPEALQGDITPLFNHLRSQRSKALAQTVHDLDSDWTQALLAEWEAFLSETSADSNAANAAVPVSELAAQRIYRTFRRIVKQGEPLVDVAEDEALHALRIECKKLRYLLEFFASLYPPAEIDALTRELKKLQDNLGGFNDLSVQQVHLLEIADELTLKDEETARALVATGALVHVLARRQDAVRGEFAERFSLFASKKNRRLYRQLFGGA